MIRYANDTDLAEVRRLWDICFPEDENFNNYYFKNLVNLKNVLVFIENDKVISMLQRLPYEFSRMGKVTYIYGVCTEPAYRSKGLMKKLMDFSFKEDIRQGIKASILIPASKSLFNMYERFGYSDAFYTSKKKYQLNGRDVSDEFEIVKCDYAHIPLMNRLYEDKLKNIGHVLRTDKYWKIQLDMFAVLSSEVLCLYNTNQFLGYSFVCTPSNPMVQEIFTIDDIYDKTFAELIIKRYNIKEIELTSIGKENKFGMIKYHQDSYYDDMAYMNLMFD